MASAKESTPADAMLFHRPCRSRQGTSDKSGTYGPSTAVTDHAHKRTSKDKRSRGGNNRVLGLLYAFALLFSGFTVALGEKNQGTILLLDEDNFTEAVQEHSDLLVLFYAPWCSVSRGFLKDFIKAAAILQKEKRSPVAAATVNMREEKRLVGRFNLPHFPIVRFYHNGKATRYPGGRGVRNLVKWVKSQQEKAMKSRHD